MTYHELNELFFKTWADEHGIIRGKPVMLIYHMNQEELSGPETDADGIRSRCQLVAPDGISGELVELDEAFLSAELKKVGLSLCLD